MAKVPPRGGSWRGLFGDPVTGTSEFNFFLCLGWFFFSEKFSFQKKLLGALDSLGLFRFPLPEREREQSLLIGQTHAGPLLKTLSVSLAMSLAFSVSAL